jgi:hypothetical protein
MSRQEPTVGNDGTSRISPTNKTARNDAINASKKYYITAVAAMQLVGVAYENRCNPNNQHESLFNEFQKHKV